MVFGRKKEPAKPEEPVTTKHVEATERPGVQVPPSPSKREPTPEELRAIGLVNAFSAEYDGIIQFGTDGTRANLLFAIYGELKRVNENLERLEQTIKAMGE
jgi:hypothetical protein